MRREGGGEEQEEEDGSGQARSIPYREIGAWEAGDKGALTLRSQAGDVLMASSLNAGWGFGPQSPS